MKKKTFLLTGTTIAVVALLSLSGCGKKANASGDSASGVKTVKFDVVATYKPYGYTDENGKPDGYEWAVLKALDKLIPEYKFELVPAGADVFTDLTTGKVDALASQWYSNDERQKKYTLTDIPYTNYGNYIAYDSNKEHDFQTLEDLRGQTLYGFANSAEIAVAEVFNAEEGGNDPIKIKYTTSSDWAKMIKDFQSGAIDATVTTDYNVKAWNKEFKSNLVTSKEPVFSGGTYYILKKGNTDLKNALDKAVTQLKEDGTLAKLSKKYLGDDYTQDPDKK
ncbi:transporter substrate-binding domain-containing protein [Pseudolactococcus yaeyamensis]